MMPSGVSAGMHDADGQPERPGGGGDQPALAVARRRVLPVAGAELVLDQPVLRRRVGHAQQRLGERHQRQPLRRGEAVFVHEILEPADAAARLADADDVAAGAGGERRSAPSRGLGEEPGTSTSSAGAYSAAKRGGPRCAGGGLSPG